MAKTAEAPPSGRAERSNRLRATVLASASDLLSERGSEGFTIEAVVQRTGVVRTTIYRHWPTRNALLAAIGGDPDAGNASRAMVLESAASLLAERGAAAFTIEAVIERSGVARSTIYRHWSSRKELLRSVIGHLTGEAPALPDTGSLRGDLLEFFLFSLDRVTSNRFDSRLRSLPSLMDLAKGDPDLQVVGAEIRNVLIGLILPILERASTRGEIRARLNLRITAQVFYATVFMPFWLGEETTEAYVGEVLDTVLHGILANRA